MIERVAPQVGLHAETRAQLMLSEGYQAGPAWRIQFEVVDGSLVRAIFPKLPNKKKHGCGAVDVV